MSGLGLVVLAPFFAAVALLIKVESAGPVFFRQERVGRRGKLFRIHKFRTMVVGAEKMALQITVGADQRITRVGFFLRKFKLDELPQLLDVFIGTMSLVGPRPEVPKYVALYPAAQREIVLSVKPGITDFASIMYRDENRLLGQSADPERTYIEEIMPIKLQYYEQYVRSRSMWMDLKIVFVTFVKLVRNDTCPD